MVEILLSVFCILLILYLGRIGASFGLFFEMTSALLLFFAMLVTMRYWYLFTQFISSLVPMSDFARSAYAAFVGYWALFLIGCIPLMVLLKLVNEDAQPKYPGVLDTLLGFVFGTVSAAIVICSVMTSLSVVLPKVWQDYEPSQLLVPLDQVPIALYQHVERNWFHISETNAVHTRLPTLEKADADNFDKYWR